MRREPLLRCTPHILNTLTTAAALTACAAAMSDGRLVGSFPAYQAPRNTASKVDSHISERVDEKLLHKTRRNFFKENMSAVRAAGAPAKRLLAE